MTTDNHYFIEENADGKFAVRAKSSHRGPFGTPYGTGDGDVPIRTSTFLAPGTPFNLYGGLKITLWDR